MSDLDRLYGRTTPAAPELVVNRPSPQPADDEDAALQALREEAAEPELYRPHVISRGGRPVLGFVLVERDGTHHGFQYHTVRHPKHQTKDGREYLDFTADGMAVLIEGTGLAILFRAMLRHVLVEVREYDGKAAGDAGTHIERMAVVDPRSLADEGRISSA